MCSSDLQVKFTERFLNVENLCSSYSIEAYRLSATFSYGKTNTAGTRIVMRVEPGTLWSPTYYSEDGFSWRIFPTSYTTMELENAKCGVAFRQSAVPGNEDYFDVAARSEVDINFWESDDSLCQDSWFIDTIANGGVGSWSSKINIPFRENLHIIISFDSVSGGFCSRNRWRNDDGIATSDFSAVTNERYYI